MAKSKIADKTKFENIYEVLHIAGLFDSLGEHFSGKKESSITHLQINEYIKKIFPENTTDDYKKRIDGTISIFNEISKLYRITGSKNGSKISKNSNFNKFNNRIEDIGYRTFVILILAYGNYHELSNLEIINQLYAIEKPLGMIAFLFSAIQNEFLIEFTYKSSRVAEITRLKEMVPVKINLRDGHWLLICWDCKHKHFNQYLLHSITELKIVEESPKTDIEKFSLEEFYKNSFGISYFINRDPIEIKLTVPKEFKEKVKQRRPEGEWIENPDDNDLCIWKVITYSEDEVFDYLF